MERVVVSCSMVGRLKGSKVKAVVFNAANASKFRLKGQKELQMRERPI